MRKQRQVFLITFAAVTVVNFLVQILYYFHQYYVTAHIPPSVIGLVLMSGVSIWFLVGLYLLIKRTLLGYILTVAFLGVEFLFYLMTQITQFMSGHGILLYVINPSDPILFIVFGVGYVNFIASAFMLYFIIRYRTVFL